jgi:exosortase
MAKEQDLQITGRRKAPRSEQPPPSVATPRLSMERLPPEPVADIPLRCALGVLLLVAGVWAYGSTIMEMVTQWEREADYSHGYLVFPAALVFLWMRRDEFPGVAASDFLLGVPLLLLSQGLRLAAAALFLDSVDGWSLLPWFAGSVAILFGRPILWWSLSSIVFLFFMVPLPFGVAQSLSYPLQTVATKLSCWTLQCLGQPAIEEGHTIIMGTHHLEVAQACSGLRIFMSIVALGYVYLVFVSRAWWLRLLILASVLPVAIVANVLRIVATAFLYEYAARSIGDKFSHDFAGWVMIPVAAGMFWLVLRYFEMLFPDSEQEYLSRSPSP